MTAASVAGPDDERPDLFIRRIRLRHLLSFGPDETDLELGPLNVLIGPNGSGKSNLIAAIGILRAAPRDPYAFPESDPSSPSPQTRRPPSGERSASSGRAAIAVSSMPHDRRAHGQPADCRPGGLREQFAEPSS